MSLTQKTLNEFAKKYKSTPINKTLENAIVKSGISSVAADHTITTRIPDVYSLKVNGGQITNQKASGRCWMFASLNAARVETMKILDVDNFEFSEVYPFFYDKLEKTNYFLESILQTKNEPLTSRLVQHLLTSPLQDGGQWDMFKGLLEKYGAIPKEIMPETFHSANSAFLNKFLTSKLREYAYELRESDNPRNKEEMLYEVYAVLCKTLGTPPEVFTYEYYDKKQNYHILKDITPVEFFKTYVNWNLKDKVSLINAPTKDKPYNKAYTVKYLGTVLEADPIRYVNVPSEVLKEAAIAQLKDQKPVWFGCDVGQMIDREHGIMDVDVFDFLGTLNTKLNLDKAARLDYGDSLLTHAMVFNGVNLDEEGKPTRWLVENSWGNDRNTRKGFYAMSDAWFDEYTYQIMVDKKYVPKAYQQALKEKLIELEPWDPMGSLALVK